MNVNTSDQVIDGLNLPANKKAKAIQKRRAAENSYEALQLKKAAAIYNDPSVRRYLCLPPGAGK